MKLLVVKIRIRTANWLVKLATWVRPKEMNQFMQAMEDSFKFGNGILRIDPKELTNEHQETGN